METTCLFCDIAGQRRKSFYVYDDKIFFAFLDKRPLFYGHCLLVPKQHVSTFYDLPQSLVGPFFLLAQHIALAVEKAMQAQGSFIAMNNKISQSVAHFHLHIVPRSKQDGLKGFFWPRHAYVDEREMNMIRLKIIEFLP